MLCLLQNRSLGLALEREKQKAAGLSAELQKTKLIGTVPQAGTTDPQVHWFSCTFSVFLFFTSLRPTDRVLSMQIQSVTILPLWENQHLLDCCQCLSDHMA